MRPGIALVAAQPIESFIVSQVCANGPVTAGQLGVAVDVGVSVTVGSGGTDGTGVTDGVALGLSVGVKVDGR